MFTPSIVVLSLLTFMWGLLDFLENQPLFMIVRNWTEKLSVIATATEESDVCACPRPAHMCRV